ncbi:hypothetical protein BTUL_0032g00360 [Botrytis tulipae]|uniref:Uncharacterized protein n=1 Tax=Botrytis tulipae TaxID=87230 RepID=A0A4Z1EUH0_9HELO|nr:hypothetical protein BTUL_0032g00360 [Botrytis tulipae]
MYLVSASTKSHKLQRTCELGISHSTPDLGIRDQVQLDATARPTTRQRESKNKTRNKQKQKE